MEFEIFGILVRLLLGLIIGFCIGLTGVGGGVLVLPALTVAIGLPASVAVGTANLYAFVTKANATYHHFKLKTVDVPISIAFLLGAIPANVAVSSLINYYVAKVYDNPQAWQNFQAGLRHFIAFVVLGCAVLLILNLIRKQKTVCEKGNRMSSRLKKHSFGRRIIALLLGLLIGALIGSTSIGGGVLIVPLLIIFFRLSASQTVGTSIFVAVVLTLVSSVIYGTHGQIDIKTAIVMAIGSMVAVPAGSKLSVKLPEKLLQTIVIGIIFLAGILMILEQAH